MSAALPKRGDFRAAFNLRRNLPSEVKYDLMPPQTLAPWADAIRAAWEPELGRRNTSELLLMAISASRAPKTYDSYKTGLNHFFEYLAEESIDPMLVTPEDAAHFLVWLAQRGTINLATAKPYYSGINQFYEDLGMPGPAKGWLFARTRAGLVNMQVELNPQPHELPLPATVAKLIYDVVCQMASTPDSARANIRLVRDMLAVILGFMTMSRPISVILLSTTDVSADPDDEQCITVTRHHVKTDRGIDRNQPGRFPLSFPHRFRALSIALAHFQLARRQTHPAAHYFFELAHDRFSPATPFGATLGDMLNHTLTVVGSSPPTGRTWTARSLRSGGASAAEKVPIPRSSIEFIGGWAAESERLAQHYIRRDTPPTHAGRFLFDWMVQPLAANMALETPS